MYEFALNFYEGMHPEYVPYITAAITVASTAAMLLPPPTNSGIRGSKVYGVVYSGVQWVALNFKNAKNASDPNVAVAHARQVLAANANDPVAVAKAQHVINNAPTASVG